MYSLFFTKEAQKTLLHLPRNTAILFRQKLEQLAEDDFESNLDIKKLQNRAGYRLRIGDWRVIYELNVEESKIVILKIATRGEVYR